VQNYGIFVVAPAIQADPIVGALSGRGLRTWSDSPGRVVGTPDARMLWADGVIVVDNSTGFRIATDPVFQECGIPKILITATSLTTAERVHLLDWHEFDNVLAWPSPLALIAALAERCVNRGSLLLAQQRLTRREDRSNHGHSAPVSNRRDS